MNYPTYASWADAVTASFQRVWFQVADFLPDFLAALVVLIIGLLAANALGKVVRTLINYTKADAVMRRIGIVDDLSRIGIPTSVGGFVGGIVKWIVIIITLLAVVDILRIQQLSIFLHDVLDYIPRVIVAILILSIGIIGGKILHNVIENAGARSTTLGNSTGPLAGLAKWAVIIFSLMAALVQLGIASSLIQILFTGIVTMLTIAGGIAFGLGGKDKAREWLERLDKEFKKDRPAPPTEHPTL